MGFAFNPFTGNFDLKGSGGGASYIDGEVATYVDLPLDGTAAINSAWLVRTASGVWPVTRKQAGIYIRTATGGSNRDSDYTYAGTLPDVFSDSQFLLYDNSDSSRNLAFDLGSISTGTTRTLTAPNNSGTISLQGHTHQASDVVFGQFDNLRINWSAPNPIGSSVASSGAFTTLTANTSLTLGTSGILSGGTNTVEQRNTTSGQTFRLYNTVSGTADANFERGFLRWNSNVLQIGTEKLGTGTARALVFQTDGATRMTIRASGEYVDFSNRISSGIIQCPSIGSNADGSAGWSFGTTVSAGASVTSVNLPAIVRYGGTTNLFPALKRDSTTLQVRLADDSAFAPLACGALTLNGNLDASTRDIATDTTTGTKIGTATTQKIGFFNATPVVQQAAVADATNGQSTQDRLNDLLARLRTLGLIAT